MFSHVLMAIPSYGPPHPTRVAQLRHQHVSLNPDSLTALHSHDSCAHILSQMHGQKEVSHPPLLASPSRCHQSNHPAHGITQHTWNSCIRAAPVPGTGVTPSGNATLSSPSTLHLISHTISPGALHVLLSKLPPPHTRGVLKLEPLWS